MHPAPAHTRDREITRADFTVAQSCTRTLHTHTRMYLYLQYVRAAFNDWIICCFHPPVRAMRINRPALRYNENTRVYTYIYTYSRAEARDSYGGGRRSIESAPGRVKFRSAHERIVARKISPPCWCTSDNIGERCIEFNIYTSNFRYTERPQLSRRS